jgi:anti-sigma factor RsiW
VTEPTEPPDDLACERFVELVTDYLEDALTPAERSLVEAHLPGCEGCSTVLDQWRETIRAAGRLAADDVDAGEVDPAARDRLLRSFRDLRRQGR